jgi:hypothetical protein
MAAAMRRQANVRAVELRPRNLSSCRMPSVLEYSEGTNGSLREMGEEGAVSGGVFDQGTHEEEGLVTLGGAADKAASLMGWKSPVVNCPIRTISISDAHEGVML